MLKLCPECLDPETVPEERVRLVVPGEVCDDCHHPATHAGIADLPRAA